MIIASSLTPISFISGPAASKASSVSTITNVSAASTISPSTVPCARALISMMVAIDPGPAIIGMAIGKTLISSASGVPLISSARSSRRSVRRSNTMSSAIMNSMIPPARRNADRLIPSVRSNGSPSKAKNSRMHHATTTDRTAIARRCAASVPLVSDAKIGAQPGGSMITSKVTKAVVNSSIIFSQGPRPCPRSPSGAWCRPTSRPRNNARRSARPTNPSSMCRRRSIRRRF